MGIYVFTLGIKPPQEQNSRASHLYQRNHRRETKRKKAFETIHYEDIPEMLRNLILHCNPCYCSALKFSSFCKTTNIVPCAGVQNKRPTTSLASVLFSGSRL